MAGKYNRSRQLSFGRETVMAMIKGARESHELTRKVYETEASKNIRGICVIRGRSYLPCLLNERDNCCDNENVNQRDLEEEKPAETHKLIVAKPGQGPSHPHKKENDNGDLCEEDGDIDQAEDPSVRPIGNSRQMPAAKK